MSPAPAQVAGERLLDVGFTRVLAGGQEGGGLHDHAVDAVAAVHGLLIDKGLLHGMRPLRRAETFQRDDLLCPDRREGHHAGAHRLAVEMHGAGAALSEATAEARRSEEHTSELQSLAYLVCRLLLEKKNYAPPADQGTCTRPRGRACGRASM